LQQARAAAEETAHRAGRWRALRSRVTAVRPSPLDPGALAVAVRIFALVPEGPMTVDLDATTGERVAFFVPCLLRGSRGGRALSRSQVVERVLQSDELPRGLRVVEGGIEKPEGARLWRLKLEPDGLTLLGRAYVFAHARTGAVVGISSNLRPRMSANRSVSHERACQVVTRALPVLLGSESRLVVLVAGALTRHGRPRAGWVGTAHDEEGEVVRVSVAGDVVEVGRAGKFARARVTDEGVALVNDQRPGKRDRQKGESTPTLEPA
jgi:hypothetical protein